MMRRAGDLNFLICEDEPLIAMDVEAALRALGGERVTIAVSSAGAIARMLADGPPDMAILDVVLADGPCFPLAETLLAAGVKVLFVTGYAQGIPERLKDCPIAREAVHGGGTCSRDPTRDRRELSG